MNELLHKHDYELNCSAEGACLSVAGNHAWVGEGPRFFIPAAVLKIGRIFSVMGALLRRRLKGIRRMVWQQERREGRFCLTGIVGCGRLVARRL